jgi:hypothetical protein
MRTIRIMILIRAFDKQNWTINTKVTRECDAGNLAVVLLGWERINYNTGDKGLS